MALDLRANTAVDVLIGPFVDDSDGNTEETGLTISQADVLLSKNGQALTQKNDATAAAHDSNGFYNCELDATDTNTEGQLVLVVHESGALPVRHEFNVMAEAAWDSLYAAKDTGYMDVNVKAVSEDTTAADNLELFVEGSALGTLPQVDLQEVDGNAAAAGRLRQWITSWSVGDVSADDGNVTITLDSVSTNDQYNGDLLLIYNGTGSQQARRIIDCEAAGNTVTIDHAFATTLDATSDYVIIPGGSADVRAIQGVVSAANNLNSACDNYSVTRGLSGTALPDAAADAAGGLPISDAGGLDLDTQIGTDIDAILADTNELQTDDIPGTLATIDGKIDTVDGNVDSILVDTGTTLEGHLTDIKGAGWSDENLTTIDANLDSALADTNELQGDWANGGRLDLIIDELTTQGDTNEGKLDTIDGIVDDILVDTGTTLDGDIQSVLGNQTVISGNVDTLLTRLSAARAGYLDELDASTSATTAWYMAKAFIALVNKMVITEASGNTEQFNDSDVSIGSIAAAFDSDGTYTTRKRLVQ